MFRLLLLLALALPARAAPALWEVKDADTTITLFGSIHLLPRGVDWFQGELVKRVDAADTLVLETVVPDAPESLSPAIMVLARSPGLPPLAERVPAALRPRLLAAVARLGTGPLDGYETWYATLTIADRQMATLGMDPRRGVEAVLSARARLLGRPIEGLETVEEQLRLFDALPEAEQRVYLAETVDELPRARAETALLVADWQAGRTDALAARLNEDFAALPTARRLLLTDRNQRWAAWIAERMKRPGRVFLAVGAGHLAGADSVQGMLAGYGLKAEPVLPPVPVKPRRARRR